MFGEDIYSSIDIFSMLNGKYEEILLNAFRGDIVFGLNTEGEEKYD